MKTIINLGIIATLILNLYFNFSWLLFALLIIDILVHVLVLIAVTKQNRKFGHAIKLTQLLNFKLAQYNALKEHEIGLKEPSKNQK